MVIGTGGPRPGLLDQAVRSRAGPKGLNRQRRVPDAGPHPAMAAAFEFCAIAVEHPSRGDQPRLVLEVVRLRPGAVVVPSVAGVQQTYRLLREALCGLAR
jgi:hypothetical protein